MARRTPLIPCEGCQRHVRVGDSSCPFCGSVLTRDRVRVRPSLGPGLKRAALFALGTSLSAAACAGDDGNDTGTANQEQGGGTATATNSSASGNPSASGSMDGNPTDPEPDDISVQPLYGAVVGPPVEGAGGASSGAAGSGGNGGDSMSGGSGGGDGRDIPDNVPLYGAVPAPID